MTLDVEVDGRTFRVTMAHPPAGDADEPIRIVVQPLDDPSAAEERFVRIRSTADGLMLVDADDGRVIDAALSSRARAEWLVQVRGVDVVATGNGRRRTGGAGAIAGGEARVCAPMPGRILRVLVDVGDSVTAGQSLVVIEAMKMENALTAAAPGVVREVAVEEGTSVEAGRLLVRLE